MNPDPQAPSAPSVQVEPEGRRPPGPPELDRTRALELLAGAAVGRVVYTVGALPAVLPVPFRLDAAGGVLLSARAGSELARAVDGAVVAFEADEWDGTDGTGWCVTVLGRAEVRPAPATGDAPDRHTDRERVLIRVGPELVVGRRLTTQG